MKLDPKGNNMSTVVQELQVYKSRGYRSLTGIYTSPVIFQGDWEKEIETLPFAQTPYTYSAMEIMDKQKGQQSYDFCAFKSIDGDSLTWNQTLTDEGFWDEEIPDNYKYTKAYYDCPQIKNIIDWFKCEKSRIRIFRQQPGHVNPLHTDFDNRRGWVHGETLRVFVQLSDLGVDSWFKFRTDDSEINTSLNRGQFVILNTDYVAHQTENRGDKPRDMLAMIIKKNDWISNLQDSFDKLTFVDVSK